MTAVPAAAASTGKAMTYVWDARNRLKEVKANGATVATFIYDAFGRRQQKTLTDAGVTTSTITIHDGHNPVQERDGTSPATIKANLRTGLGMDEFMSRSEIVVSGGTTTTTNRHFLTNHLGSVLALTDAAGAITKNYKYEPYGKVTTTGETSTNPYQYTGRENDIAGSGVNPTGLYFYRARYYDASAQRFISEDPIGLDAGLNLFRYVGANPVTYADPSGHLPWIPILGCGLSIYGGWEIGQTLKKLNEQMKKKPPSEDCDKKELPLDDLRKLAEDMTMNLGLGARRLG
jgi:RHS repeat-associated protein